MMFLKEQKMMYKIGDMMKNKKIVYVPLAVDILHTGHLNIINTAKKYGKVVIGLLSD